jgi:hypothetical protein
MPLDYILTKGKYCKGIQCLKLLYAEENIKEDEDVDLVLELKLKQGLEVLEAARKRFPDGVLIEHEPWKSVLERTQKEIEGKTPIIFEATFLFDEVLVRIDVLRRVDDDLFDVIEVKSGTSIKEEHIPDVAVQRYVLEGAGYGVNKTYLMHLNKGYIHPNQNNLFEIEDCTDSVLIHLPDVKNKIKTQKETLQKNKEPVIEIGPQCAGPYECVLKDECWDKIPEISIFNIPRLRFTRKWDLFGNGIIDLKDLPSGYKLNVKQDRFVESAMKNKPYIDKKEIKKELDLLSEPIYFVDFETMNWAIPRYPNSSPYNQIPFQWSLHILKDGRLDHLEYLSDTPLDPRPDFTQGLVDNIGASGPIMVYHASFEGGILNRLASHFPDNQNKLHNMVSRLWDLEKIFLNHYMDHTFKGRTSIKNVLPVMVPSLGYDELEIGGGGLAQAEWVRMIKSEGKEKERLRRALLEYCKMDTLAMVEIYKQLKKIA